MNIRLLLSLVFVVIMVVIMRNQGDVLITPVSRHGIIDLEFAKTGERLQQLLLFWNPRDVRMNIYLDFLFILAYTSFFVLACNHVRDKKRWANWGQAFTGIAIAAGLFDICENFLMLMVLNGRFNSWALQIVYYCAGIKFILAAATIVFLIISVFFKSKQTSVHN